MENLTEKVSILEKRLNELGGVFDTIRVSLTSEHGKQHHSVRTKSRSRRPDWVGEIFKCFDQISAELKDVKETLDARTLTENGHVQMQASVTNVRAASRARPPRTAPVNGQPEAVSPNQSSQEPPPQSVQGFGRCEIRLTPSIPTKPSNPTTNANVITLPHAQFNGTAPTFRCNYKDISKLKEAKFEKFSSHPNVKEDGYFKLVVERLPPITVEEASFHQPVESHRTNFSCRWESEGFVELAKKPNEEIPFPNFPLPESQQSAWSREELKEFWESNLKNPPQDMLYIVGNPLFPDIELDPGEGFKRIGGRLHDFGTTYIYLSFAVSYSIMHGEDLKFRSINLLRSGEHKFWLVVKPAYERELERRMREEFPTMSTCSQAVRHLSRVIAPSKLDEWKIPYSLDYCKPGEAIVTEPGAFHQVLNLGANYAIAINILYGSSSAIPNGYRFCQKSCGPHAITASHIQKFKEVPLAEVQLTQKIRLSPANPTSKKQKSLPAEHQSTQPQPTVGQPNIATTKRKASPAERQSRNLQITPYMGNLFDAVCGKEAFHHLCSLIRSWRDRSKPLFEINEDSPLGSQLVKTIGVLGERSQLTDFLGRLARVKLVEIIDNGKMGRISADPQAITNLINDLKWDNTKRNREKLHGYLKDGRRWKRVCGNFDGLLCLIPPNREDKEHPRISGHLYQKLSENEMQQFHSLLNSNQYIEPLCRMGNTFQASLWNKSNVPEFRWESEDPKEIARLSIEKLAPLMGEFPLIAANVCDFEKYDWPKPDCWPWDWPQNPTWVPPSDIRCNLCNGDKCDCMVTCLPQNKPRITNEGEVGQGVRVFGATYPKGQILGELLGELVPLDTHSDGWPIELRRPDLSDEPIAQIYPREMGNWVRKVNHSCNPSAEFRVMKISGWWRQMLIAIQDIPHNGEITAFCGRGFLRGQGKSCFCEVCRG